MTDKLAASSSSDPSNKTISVPVFHLYHNLLPGSSVCLCLSLSVSLRLCLCLSVCLSVSLFSLSFLSVSVCLSVSHSY